MEINSTLVVRYGVTLYIVITGVTEADPIIIVRNEVILYAVVAGIFK